ncbi:hypothetical protein F0562_024875 [Nyssa sinensis]|uniref:Uncharacterized protein n=1 Tax=Nyssa sinensis TaxID=561372 RepID=A0A5J5BGX0_9ASTE|nr:hypothetical protein F0562_024875 [Nyssa sinensis]
MDEVTSVLSSARDVIDALIIAEKHIIFAEINLPMAQDVEMTRRQSFHGSSLVFVFGCNYEPSDQMGKVRRVRVLVEILVLMVLGR